MLTLEERWRSKSGNKTIIRHVLHKLCVRVMRRNPLLKKKNRSHLQFARSCVWDTVNMLLWWQLHHIGMLFFYTDRISVIFFVIKKKVKSVPN